MKPRRHGPAAIQAPVSFARGCAPGHGTVIPHRLPATLAIEKRHPAFDGNQRDKKETEVVIHLLQAGLEQSAPRAAPGRGIDGSGSGLYAGNEEAHGVGYDGKTGSRQGAKTSEGDGIVLSTHRLLYWNRSAGIPFERRPGVVAYDFLMIFLRLSPAMPINPLPSNSRVAGSGTGALWLFSAYAKA